MAIDCPLHMCSHMHLWMVKSQKNSRRVKMTLLSFRLHQKHYCEQQMMYFIVSSAQPCNEVCGAVCSSTLLLLCNYKVSQRAVVILKLYLWHCSTLRGSLVLDRDVHSKQKSWSIVSGMCLINLQPNGFKMTAHSCGRLVICQLYLVDFILDSFCFRNFQKFFFDSYISLFFILFFFLVQFILNHLCTTYTNQPGDIYTLQPMIHKLLAQLSEVWSKS